MRYSTHSQSLVFFLIPFAMLFPLGGCFNPSPLPTLPQSDSSATGMTQTATGSGGWSPLAAPLEFSISQVTLGQTGSTWNAQVFLNPPSTGSNTLRDVCVTSQGVSCVCQFSWMETNRQVDPPVSYVRSAQTVPSQVQRTFVTCPLPSVYATEIPNQTTISLSLIPNPLLTAGQPPRFQTGTFDFVKGSTSPTALGAQLIDIFRYTCFQTTRKGTSIQSKIFTSTSPSGSLARSAYASQFCFAKVGSTVNYSDPNCPNLEMQPSAQSYYYQFYLPASELGNINISNGVLECPKVQESLDQTSLYWPLDSQFALSSAPTPFFSIGVEGYSKISGNGAVSSTCDSSNSGSPPPPSNSAGRITSCLGFATPPNAQGVCPVVAAPGGKWVQTFRLRRYVALYPPFFDTQGEPIAGASQNLDTVYVIDRPVTPASTPLNSSVIPASILGPKPCPFAFYDRAGFLTGQPGYFGTQDNRWKNKNFDGILFPNQDIGSNGVLSCSSLFAVPVFSGGVYQSPVTGFTLKTLRPNLDFLYARSPGPFWMHYEEDPMFEACAPLSQEFQDPPLHFALEPFSKNVSWCAEAYATVNPLIRNTNAQATSHLWQGASSPRTLIESDLTGTPDSNTSRATPIPLLAPEADVEAVLIRDRSYQCSFTSDGEKSLPPGQRTPRSGCCEAGVTPVTPGANVLKFHLDPSVACGLPND